MWFWRLNYKAISKINFIKEIPEVLIHFQDYVFFVFLMQDRPLPR